MYTFTAKDLLKHYVGNFYLLKKKQSCNKEEKHNMDASSFDIFTTTLTYKKHPESVKFLRLC